MTCKNVMEYALSVNRSAIAYCQNDTFRKTCCKTCHSSYFYLVFLFLINLYVKFINFKLSINYHALIMIQIVHKCYHPAIKIQQETHVKEHVVCVQVKYNFHF